MALLDPQRDPTSPETATVQGIAQPAKPMAITGMTPSAPAPTAMQATATPSQGMLPASSLNFENDSVSQRVADITSKDSPIMEQARTSGLKLANSRGLLNSSIAIGAAEDSAYRAATPIASQEAAQAAARNAQRLGLTTELERMREAAGFDKEARQENFGYQTQLQQHQFDARMKELEKQQAGEVDRLKMQIASAEGMQKTALQAEMDRLLKANELELTRMGAAFEFNKAMAGIQQGYAVDMAKLNTSLQSMLQAQGNAEHIQRMMVDFGNQLQLNAQQNLAALANIAAQGDVQMQLQTGEFAQRLKELTLNLNNQNARDAAAAAVNLFSAESQIRAAIMSNPNMPAAERSAALQALANISGPTQAFINSILGSGGNAGGAGGGGGSTGQTPQTNPVAAQEPTGGMLPSTGGGGGAARPGGTYVSGGIAPGSGYQAPTNTAPAGGVGNTTGAVANAVGADAAPARSTAPAQSAPQGMAPAAPGHFSAAQTAEYNRLVANGMTPDVAAAYVEGMTDENIAVSNT